MNSSVSLVNSVLAIASPVEVRQEPDVVGSYPNEFGGAVSGEAHVEFSEARDSLRVTFRHAHPNMDRSREIVLDLVRAPSAQVLSQLVEMARVTEACSCRFRCGGLPDYPEASKSMRRNGKDDMQIVQFINTACVQVQLDLNRNRR